MRVGLGFDRRDGPADVVVGAVHRAVAEALRGASGLEAAASQGRESVASGEAASGERVDGETELREIVRHIERQNYQVVNLDITILTDRPHPEGVLKEIREGVASLVHVAPASVATKESELNPITGPQAGGCAAIAIALLDQISDLDALHASIRSGG